jgi:epoxyqueuosine reductase
MDARRCISYLTIELRDAIPEQLRGDIGEWVFGCDVCQQACPYNSKAPPSAEPAFAPGPQADGLDLQQMLCWTQPTRNKVVKGTAMARAKLAMMRRNAAVAMGNLATAWPPELTKAADDKDAMVAEHARWAKQRLTSRRVPHPFA